MSNTIQPQVIRAVEAELLKNEPRSTLVGGVGLRRPSMVRPTMAARLAAAAPAAVAASPAAARRTPPRTVGKAKAREMLINLGFPENLLGTAQKPKIPASGREALKVRGVLIRKAKKAAKPAPAAKKTAKKAAKKATTAKKKATAKKHEAEAAAAAAAAADKKAAKKKREAAAAKKKAATAKKTAKKVAKKAAKKTAKKPAAKKTAAKKTAAKKTAAKKTAAKKTAKKSAKAAAQVINMTEARKVIKAAGGTLPKKGISKDQRAALRKQGVTVKRATKK